MHIGAGSNIYLRRFVKPLFSHKTPGAQIKVSARPYFHRKYFINMYIVILYSILEWSVRTLDESFVECRRLKALVNTTQDSEFQAIYIQRTMDEDARVWSTVNMPGSQNVDDACNLPHLLFWLRIIGTLATVIVSLPYCIRSAQPAETECAESLLPSNPENDGPPPTFPSKPSPTEDQTESPTPSSKPKQREYPSVTPDSPSTPRLLYNP